MMLLDRAALFEEAFQEHGGADLVGGARLDFLERFFGIQGAQPRVDAEDLEDIAWSFESLGISQLREGASEKRAAGLFEIAYWARSSAWSSGREHDWHHAWMLAVAGTLAHKQPEVRLLLRDFDLFVKRDSEDTDWAARLWRECSRAL